MKTIIIALIALSLTSCKKESLDEYGNLPYYHKYTLKVYEIKSTLSAPDKKFVVEYMMYVDAYDFSFNNKKKIVSINSSAICAQDMSSYFEGKLFHDIVVVKEEKINCNR